MGLWLGRWRSLTPVAGCGTQGRSPLNRGGFFCRWLVIVVFSRPVVNQHRDDGPDACNDTVGEHVGVDAEGGDDDDERGGECDPVLHVFEVTGGVVVCQGTCPWACRVVVLY